MDITQNTDTCRSAWRQIAINVLTAIEQNADAYRSKCWQQIAHKYQSMCWRISIKMLRKIDQSADKLLYDTVSYSVRWHLLKVCECVCTGMVSAALCHFNPATIDFRLFVVCLFLSKLLCAQIISCMCVYRDYGRSVSIALAAWYFPALIRVQREAFRGNLKPVNSKYTLVYIL